MSLLKNTFNPEVKDDFKKDGSVTISGGGNSAAKAFILADVLREDTLRQPLLWVVNDEEEQRGVAGSLSRWAGCRVLTLQKQEAAVQDDKEETAKENLIAMLKAIQVIMEAEPRALILTYAFLMQNTPDFKTLRSRILSARAGDEISTTDFFEELISRGYEVSDDDYLERGTYRGQGGMVTVFPVTAENPVRIEFDFDKVASITEYDQLTGEITGMYKKVHCYPINIELTGQNFFDFVSDETLFVEDELEVTDEYFDMWGMILGGLRSSVRHIRFTSFPEDIKGHHHLRYLSVLKYQDLADLATDVREKVTAGWKILYFTKNKEEVEEYFASKNLELNSDVAELANGVALNVIGLEKGDAFPEAFQNADLNFVVLSDREVVNLHRDEKSLRKSQKVYWDFLSGLKTGDLVVHVNHGIARFLGLQHRVIDSIPREYLELGYAENDKLYVPIDQADKVNKFVGAEEDAPHLTRLGSAEWTTITKRVKKETQKIAKELLLLYAQRKQALGHKYSDDVDEQKEFEATFPYDETPGQIKAILDVKKDMESNLPMDRLVCGDVGFGKTEVAMRAAFKAVKDGRQVALISPITILADQHYRSFKERMEEFHVRVEVLSRFRSPRQQKETLERLKKGEADIVVGTHRLLQTDVEFKNLGLVIVDEEQRFGVKQKEKFKELRKEVDILTLTATPIPRTLNICLNKLRDITTITTPPPGRLPVITEVRKFSNELIREAILREIKRGGQVYFLHNRVQTIDGVAEKLKMLIPEARFGIAHGKLLSRELEERIIDFKDHKFDVLVSSAIIENGIDLPNANTLIVNNAEKFGLAQLYQLRGRVGRGKSQAFAYFLYHAQRLRLDAKKRLRAIVEASELGSGFQIAMKDLEIRGAGDILGVSQHGVINVVGVSHFIRMLNRAVEDLQSGKTTKGVEEPQEVSVELPIPAFIPDSYIVNSKDKINAYQKLAAADTKEYLEEIRAELVEDYGRLPKEVFNLLAVVELKMAAKRAGITLVKAENMYAENGKQIVLYMGSQVRPENIVNMLEYNSRWKIIGSKLQIDLKELGLNWLAEVTESLRALCGKVGAPGEKKAEKKATV